jgi:hypothetical protein
VLVEERPEERRLHAAAQNLAEEPFGREEQDEDAELVGIERACVDGDEKETEEPFDEVADDEDRDLAHGLADL